MRAFRYLVFTILLLALACFAFMPDFRVRTKGWLQDFREYSGFSERRSTLPGTYPPTVSADPVDLLKTRRIPAGQRVYLKKQMATVAESFNTINNNRAWQGSPISVGGKTYKRGLGVHADSKLVFDLNREFATFHVVPGPDDAHKGTLSMKILVDEKEVFSSGSTSSRDKKARRPLKIDVTGAKQRLDRDPGRGVEFGRYQDLRHPGGEGGPSERGCNHRAIPNRIGSDSGFRGGRFHSQEARGGVRGCERVG